MRFKHTKESHIGIVDDPLDPNGLQVSRETFWVSPADVGDGDQAEWFCLRHHQHTTNCFVIYFDKPTGSPFNFPTGSLPSILCNTPGHAVSPGIGVHPGSAIYQYRIEAPGKNPLDPGGGVKA
jgi:hypothetical protein